jgi:hypothetical protein
MVEVVPGVDLAVVAFFAMGDGDPCGSKSHCCSSFAIVLPS